MLNNPKELVTPSFKISATADKNIAELLGIINAMPSSEQAMVCVAAIMLANQPQLSDDMAIACHLFADVLRSNIHANTGGLDPRSFAGQSMRDKF
jgi:hypothetical protein